MNYELYSKIKLTFKREGFGAVLLKSRRRIRYAFLRLMISDKASQAKWMKLKNKFKGKRVFLIGNGPSLNKTPLYLLKDEYIMCFNRFHIMLERLNWQPNFYATVDNLVLSDMVDEIDDVLLKTEYVFLPDVHFRGQQYYKKIGDREKIYWLKQVFGQGFSAELPKVYPGGSVIYEGFQILNYLGFKDIYFLGVDMNFKIHDTAKSISSNETDIISQGDDDPNHFDPRYFGKNKRYHQPEEYIVKYIIQNLEYLSKVMSKHNMNIVNVGYDSKVSCFPKKNFEDLFEYTNEEKERLLNQCFENNSNYKSVSEFINDSSLVSTFINIESVGNFYTNLELGLKLIQKAVFTHIPIGPYNGQYYFVKRV